MWDLAVSSDCLCIYPSTLSLIFANIVPFLSDDYQNCNAHLEFSHLNCFYLGLLFYHQWSLILNPEFLFQKGSSVSYRVVMKVFLLPPR